MTTKQSRLEFRAFCRNATHSQLSEIIRRERIGAESDPDREIYHEIAVAEREARCRATRCE